MNFKKLLHFEDLGKHALKVQLNYVWHCVHKVVRALLYTELYFLLDQLQL